MSNLRPPKTLDDETLNWRYPQTVLEKEWVTKHYLVEYARLENAILDFSQGSLDVLIGNLPMQEPNR